MARLMFKVLVVFAMVICVGYPCLHATEGQKFQEGQFAVQLAKRLHLAKNPSTAQAIDLLTKAGIIPREGWQPAKPADEELIVRTQVPFNDLLLKMCRSVGVPAPPTLSQQVLYPPYGPQRIIFTVPTIMEGKASEGAFAVKLVQNLKLAKNPLSDKEAIALLSKIGIKPLGDTPTGGWNSEKKATDLFVVKIQISILHILKEVALQNDIPLPPTINVSADIEERSPDGKKQ